MADDRSIEEIFAAMIGQAESEKTASEGGGEGGVQKPVEKPAEGDAEKTAALVKIAKALPKEALDVLQKYVTDVEESEKRAEDEKKAAEAEAMGRFMARGYVAELQKLSEEGTYQESQMGAAFSDANLTGGAAVQTKSQPNVIQNEEGATVISTAKKEDGQKSPSSPTASQDTVKVVKSILEAANVATKGQDPQEVPNNLGITETASGDGKAALKG